MDIAKQKVVVIGGSSGIGLAVAQAVVAAGGQVAIAGRSSDKLKAAQSQIGEQVATYQLDIADEASVKSFFLEIGAFDALVVTAFLGITGSFLELETAQARQVFESKFWGQYYAAKYAAAQINVAGSITLFSGSAAHKPIANLSALAAANGAVEALARSLAVELSPIRVNVVSPGLVATPAYDGMSAEYRKDYFEQVANALPAKRIGQPEDIAQTVLYLMQNKFTTGSVVNINGGTFL